MAEKQKTQQTGAVPIRLLPARPTPRMEDDWFQLFDGIGEESVLEVQPIPLPPVQGEGGDDWFTWFSVVREKPVVIPLGKKTTAKSPKNICFSAAKVENFSVV